MISLFLNNTQVYIDTTTSIKITRENSFFTSQGDYTFDVTAPLSIASNRTFFGNWHRIEAKKSTQVYSARLYAEGRCLLNGSAKVTKITEEAVTLQLYGDRSEFNSIYGDMYIDRLSLPSVSYPDDKYQNTGGSSGGRRSRSTTATAASSDNSINSDDATADELIFSSVYNETTDEIANFYSACRMQSGVSKPISALDINKVPQWNLLFIVKSIFAAIGYTVDFGIYNDEPYTRIYMANAYIHRSMATALPHWTLKDFAEQLQYFFGCRLIFSSSNHKVTMVKNSMDALTEKCYMSPL